MNTELIDSMVGKVTSNQMVTTHEVNLEKLVELVVLECARVMTEGFPVDTALSEGPYYINLGRTQAAVQIKEHFGIFKRVKN